MHGIEQHKKTAHWQVNGDGIKQPVKDSKYFCDDLDFDPESDFLIWDKHEDVAQEFSRLNQIYKTRQSESVRRLMKKSILSIHFFVGQLLRQQSQLYGELQYQKTTIAQLRDIVQEYAHQTGTDPQVIIAFLRIKALTQKAIADTNKLLEGDNHE